MYRKVDFDINGDERFRELSPQPPSAQGLFIQLLIGKHTTMLPGVIPASPAEISASLGWPIDDRSLPEGFGEGFGESFMETSWKDYAQGCPHGSAAMAELVDFRMAKVDDRAGLIWLPNALKRNPPPSPNHLTAWSKEWGRIPRCQLKHEIFHDWRGFFDSYGKTYEKVFMESFLEPYPEGLEEGYPKGCREPGSRKQEAVSGARSAPRESEHRPSKEKAPRSRPVAPPGAVAVAEYLLTAIRSHNPAHVATEAQLKAWALDIDRAMRIDKRTICQLEAVIDAAHRDDGDTFWRPNLLSGSKLRKQFDKIAIRIKKTSAPRSVKVGSVEAKDIDKYPEVGTEENW